MTLCFFLAIVLGAITEAATVRPVFASVAVARDSRRVRAMRAIRVARTRVTRAAIPQRPWFTTLAVRRFLAPLTGAAAPRAPAFCR